MKLRKTASVVALQRLPKNLPLLRPSAISRLARSVAPLPTSNSPSFRKRVNACSAPSALRHRTDLLHVSCSTWNNRRSSGAVAYRKSL